MKYIFSIIYKYKKVLLRNKNFLFKARDINFLYRKFFLMKKYVKNKKFIFQNNEG